MSTSDADDCLSIAEINYLLQTRQIDHVILADTMVSLDGLRADLERHVGHDPDERSWPDVTWSEGAFPWEMGHRKQQSASTNAVVL